MNGPRRASRRGRIASVLVLACVCLAGCAGVAPEPQIAGVATATATSPGTPTTPSATALTAADLRMDFAALQKQYGGQLALAWAPVGNAAAVQVLGSTTDDEAWSTMKVPIAVATQQGAKGAPTRAQQALLRKMITVSDNAAAKSLWDALDNSTARVNAVLRAGGDSTTSARPDKGKTSEFGLTAWRPVDQARFAAMLPCTGDAVPVLELMSQVDKAQSWGLGTIKGARFKGGWGPSPHGYLARQIGILPVAGTEVAVSIAVQPPDRSHATATAALGKVAALLGSRLRAADGGSCRT